MKPSHVLYVLATGALLLAACNDQNPVITSSNITPASSQTSSVDDATYYTVSFDLNGGETIDPASVAPQKVKEGRWAKAPSIDPTKKHCTFLGWYAVGDEVRFSFNQGIYGDITLVAKWKVNEDEKITLHFNPNNGDDPFTIETFIGDHPTINNPKKEGMVFVGWYKDGDSNSTRFAGYVSEGDDTINWVAVYEKQAFNFYYVINEDNSATITGIIDINASTVEIPEMIGTHPVTGIAANAFGSRINITEINIPKTVIDISPKAFLGTRALQKFTVASDNPAYRTDENGILFTRDGTTLVFCPPKALTNNTAYTCPSTLKKIGDYAFYGQGDAGLASITFNAGLEEIGASAFAQNERLNNVAFPSSLKKIGDHAFATYNAATDQFIIAWSEGLEEIGDDAFMGCYIKGNLDLPSTVKKIGNYAFCTPVNSHCAITSVKLPASLEFFGDAAFFYGYGIKNLSLGTTNSNANFVVENNMLFSADKKILYWVPSDTTSALALDEALVIPEGVEEIGPHALSDVRFISKGITLPSTLKTIDHNAFHYNLNITSLEIPDSVTTIGEEAFMMMDKLSSIKIGKGVTEIPSGCFYEDKALSSVTIPSNVKKIDEQGFADCRLTSVTFEEGVEEIGEEAFVKMTADSSYDDDYDYAYGSSNGLVNVNLPNSLVTLGDAAFAGQSNITTINFGTGLKNFGNQVFGAYNSNEAPKPTSLYVKASSGPQIVNTYSVLSSDGKTLFYTSPALTGKIEIPSTVTKIGNYAFERVKATGISFNSAVEEIGEGAFEYAFNSNSKVAIDLPASLKTLDDGAFYMANIEGVTFHEGLTSIGESAFSYLNNLGALNFPSTLKNIGEGAFFASGVTGITLNEGLTSIGDNAFLGNAQLAGVITIPSTLTKLGEGAFLGRVNDYVTGITDYVVAAGNTAFTAENGALYSADGTKLYAYASKRNATDLTLKSTVKTILPYGLAGAANLLTLTLPEGLERIGEYGLAYIKGVKSLTIPSSILSMGYRTFDGWTKSQAINMPMTEDDANRLLGTDWRNSCNATINYKAGK